MKNQYYLLILILILILSGTILLTKVSKPLKVSSYWLDTQTALNNIGSYLSGLFTNKSKTYIDTNFKYPKPSVNADYVTELTTPKPINNTNTNSSSQTTIIINGQKVYDSKTLNRPLIKNQNCHRFTVPHLDGSSSYLCYSLNDYNELSRLSNELSTAKSNLNFEEKVIKMYEEAKLKSFDPSFYQEPIEKASQKAREYRDKIGQILVQMYNIESRGK